MTTTFDPVKDKDLWLDIDTRGFEEMVGDQLRALDTEAPKVIRRGALNAETDVKDNLVPVGETGDLSGSIEGKADEDGLGFTLGAYMDYAAAQEVNFMQHHPNKGPTGERGAYYISRGIDRAAENIQKDTAEMSDKVLEAA